MHVEEFSPFPPSRLRQNGTESPRGVHTCVEETFLSSEVRHEAEFQGRFGSNNKHKGWCHQPTLVFRSASDSYED
jgi:hypothetical protein